MAGHSRCERNPVLPFHVASGNFLIQPCIYLCVYVCVFVVLHNRKNAKHLPIHRNILSTSASPELFTTVNNNGISLLCVMKVIMNDEDAFTVPVSGKARVTVAMKRKIYDKV